MLSMMIDICPKFYALPSTCLYMILRSRSQTLIFYVKVLGQVFRASLFPNPLIDFVHVWYNDGYWSKILWGTIPTPVYDLKVKVTDLEFLCLSSRLKVLGPHYFQTRSCI